MTEHHILPLKIRLHFAASGDSLVEYGPLHVDQSTRYPVFKITKRKVIRQRTNKVEATPTKRKRGRPRKYPQASSQSQAWSASSASKSSKKKKRRRRRSKGDSQVALDFSEKLDLTTCKFPMQIGSSLLLLNLGRVIMNEKYANPGYKHIVRRMFLNIIQTFCYGCLFSFQLDTRSGESIIA